jgi:ferritin-like metal-binding protein YciE
MQYKIAETEQVFLDMLNQVFELEKKAEKLQESNSLIRNINNLKRLFEEKLYAKSEAGFVYENPIGQTYTDTRTDCDASITSEGNDNLVITEVLKPIIRLRQGGLNQLVQKAVVIVQSQPIDKQA